jgi:hypothetical protein
MLLVDLNADAMLDVVTASDTGGLWRHMRRSATSYEALLLDAAVRRVTDLAAADIDRDGDMDVIYCTPTALFWSRNNGATFDMRVVTAASASNAGKFAHILLFDGDSDGDVDIVTVGISAVTLFPRVSSGFGAAVTLTTAATLAGDGGQTVAISGASAVDFDGDGDEDLVVVLSEVLQTSAVAPAAASADWLAITGVPPTSQAGALPTSAVVWLENRASKYEVLHAILDSFYVSSEPIVVDVDLDDDFDVIVAGDVSVYLVINDNNVEFRPQDLVEVSASSLRAVDVDGQLHLVLFNDATFEGFVVPMGAVGDGELLEATPLSDTPITAAAAADVDGDGDVDFAVAFQSAAVVGSASVAAEVILNTCGVAKECATAVPLPWPQSQMGDALPAFRGATADFTGDGHTDILIVSEDSSRQHVLLRAAPSAGGVVFADSILPASSLVRTQGVLSVSAVDVDGDRDMDAVVFMLGVVYWLRNSAGSLAVVAPRIGTFPAESQPFGFALDMTGDLKADVVAWTLETANLVLFRFVGTTSTTFAPSALIVQLDDVVALAGGDVDGDGDNDVVAAVVAADYLSCPIVWLSNTRSTFAPAATLTSVAGAVNAILVTDLDGDGDADMMIVGDSVLWLENRRGSPPVVAQRVVLPTVRTEASSVQCADIDGDGDMDCVVTQPYDDTLLLLRGGKNGAGYDFAPSYLAKGSSVGATGVGLARLSGGAALDVAVWSDYVESLQYLELISNDCEPVDIPVAVPTPSRTPSPSRGSSKSASQSRSRSASASRSTSAFPGGPRSRSSTASVTATMSRSRAAISSRPRSNSATKSPSASPTRSLSASRSISVSRTASTSRSASKASKSRTASSSPSVSRSRTVSTSKSLTRSKSVSASASTSRSAVKSRTPLPSRSASASWSARGVSDSTSLIIAPSVSPGMK